MTVAEWPSYLIRRIPADTRARMTERAVADDMSLADVVRQALCARYRMECDPASYGYQADLDSSGDMLLVRLQPDVWAAMRQETEARYGATKRLVLESIDDYLEAP
jgi:hypothetical protein